MNVWGDERVEDREIVTKITNNNEIKKKKKKQKGRKIREMVVKV